MRVNIEELEDWFWATDLDDKMAVCMELRALRAVEVAAREALAAQDSRETAHQYIEAWDNLDKAIKHLDSLGDVRR